MYAASRRPQPESDLEPRRRLARCGIAVDAPFVRNIEIRRGVRRRQMHAAFEPRAGLAIAVRDRRIDADESAAAARKHTRARADGAIEPDRELAGPRVVDERVLDDAAVLERQGHGGLPNREQVGGASADRVP